MREQIKNALLRVTDKVRYGYRRDDTKDKYIVYEDDGQGDVLWGDGKLLEMVIRGSIDYFTTDEDDPNFFSIMEALNDAGIPFAFEMSEYIEHLMQWHHVWSYEYLLTRS